MTLRPRAVGLLALAELHLTVWPHEVGHAAVAYAVGCRGRRLRRSWLPGKPVTVRGRYQPH